MFPLWRVNEQGRACKWGDLYPCWPQGSCLVMSEEGTWQWFDGLPWYLTDLRPQGFLGRSWGRSIASQYQLPEDIRLWQETDVLYALNQFYGENPGGWLVGEENYQRWLASEPPEVITENQKLQAYAQLSRKALAGEVIGSSAGGEQPKFTCVSSGSTVPAHVLVKFTAPQYSPVSERWGDLLFAEAIALRTLVQTTIAASEAIPLQGDNGQVFLEAVRFDCLGVSGRRAIVSLEAVLSEFASAQGGWPKAVGTLARAGIVETQTTEQVERIWAFGCLISNSDMHAGNLSFYLSDLPLTLTPVYDMLPMAFAPTSLGMMREEACELRFDATVSRQAWEFALPLARQFWDAVAADARISERFRAIAVDMQYRLDDIEAKIRRMA